MASYMIVIQGTGQHHGNDPKDADVIAKEFVKRLKDNGQNIKYSLFISSGVDVEEL